MPLISISTCTLNFHKCTRGGMSPVNVSHVRKPFTGAMWDTTSSVVITFHVIAYLPIMMLIMGNVIQNSTYVVFDSYVCFFELCCVTTDSNIRERYVNFANVYIIFNSTVLTVVNTAFNAIF